MGERAIFGSRLAVIFATVGSAVGLGNIWRFPYMLGSNGGAAFLVIYLLCTLLLGFPVMLAEFYIGRHSRRNAVDAFRSLSPGTPWALVGFNGVLAAFLILGFYYVIAGWTLEYIFQSLTEPLAGKSAADFAQHFNTFSSDIFRPLVWTFAFILITHSIIVSGVKNGIERFSKVLMPILFVILLVLSVRSLLLPGAMAGLEFLFNPDFSKINSSVLLSAMGQAFFSLSIGMGCMITYSSYFSSETHLQRSALETTLLDTIVALLASVVIFPAVFNFGIAPTAGVELIFITLPNVFGKMPLGNMWAVIFFVLIAVAALTSTISLHEVATLYLHENHHLSRRRATTIVSIGTGALTILSSLSFGVLKHFTVADLTFFELLDFLTAKIMLPLGGIFICLFVGWRTEKYILQDELTNKNTITFYFFNTFRFFMQFVCPFAIMIIFLHELGLFDWLKHIF